MSRVAYGSNTIHSLDHFSVAMFADDTIVIMEK